MLNKTVVQKALKRSLAFDANPKYTHTPPLEGQSSITSQLIFDIYGGEILKTHKKKGWHFYNRINGERIDLAISEMGKSPKATHFEDIPSNSDETNNYFEQEDYSTLFNRFIRTFEEIIGLNKYQTGIIT